MFRKLILLIVLTVAAHAAPVYLPANTSVTLLWEYPHDGRAYGFRLYNAAALFSPFDAGAYISVATNNGIDTFSLTTSQLSAGLYDFSLTAVDAAGQESDSSNHVAVEALPKPSAPQTLRKR